MNIKAILLVLLLVSMSFATVPTWVRPGANLTYSAGSSVVSFKVLEVTAQNVRTQVESPTRTINENASADYGQFWFDNTTISEAVVGQTIAGFEVKSIGRQTFASKEWDTITIEGTVSGVITTKTYDKNSGLLLRQIVSVSGAPTVTLTGYAVPAWMPPPAPPIQNQTNTTTPRTNTTNSTNTTTTPPIPPAPSPTPAPAPVTNNQSTTNQTNQTVEIPIALTNQSAVDDLSPPKTISCCGSSAVVLLALFGAFIINKK